MNYTVHRSTWLVVHNVGTLRVGTSIHVTDSEDIQHTGIIKEIRESADTVFIVLNTGYVFNIDNAKYLRVDT